MSLVRPTALFGNLELYTSESHSSDNYDPNYFLDSPSEELVHTSRSNALESPDVIESLDFSEDRIGLKLQELEKALLDDNFDDDCDNQEHIMEIDGDWSVDPTRSDDSPKESSSMNSKLSSNKEISFSAFEVPKRLLFECAAAIQNGNLDEASHMINVLRQKVSIQGEPSERIAAYMVEALAARIAASGRGLYKVLKCKVPPSSDRLSAMQVLFEACPCFRFGFMAANGAILESFKNEKTVHIIDFDINQGSQYYTLLQSLSKTPGNRPHVKLTGVDDPESVQRSVGGLEIIGKRLEQLAKDLELSFQFRAIASETTLISPLVLNIQPGEALVVNFAFQLHHLPDESVSTVNIRDQLLRMVKSLKPKLVTLVEQDVNTNTSPFLMRVEEAYNYYSAVFESLDAALGRDSQDRFNVEKQCLARDIINVIACEGEERIERYEVAGKWRARMTMAGFTPNPISRNVKDEIEKLIKMYSDRYKVKDETGALLFGWEEKILIVCSAWR